MPAAYLRIIVKRGKRMLAEWKGTSGCLRQSGAVGQADAYTLLHPTHILFTFEKRNYHTII
jgi:hypothetical protein